MYLATDFFAFLSFGTQDKISVLKEFKVFKRKGNRLLQFTVISIIRVPPFFTILP